MHKRYIIILAWSVFISLIGIAASVSSKHLSDPSVPDETDLSVIDSFLKAVGENKTDNSNPNRGSLPEPSKQELNSTTVANPAKQPNGCKCVKYFMCDVTDAGQNTTGNSTSNPDILNANQTLPNGGNGTSSQDIFGIVDIRKAELKNAQDNSTLTCESIFDVCCPLSHIKASNETQNSSIPITVPPSTTPNPPHLSQEGQQHTRCGRRNEKGVGFTLTGATQNEAQFGEFPWTVALVNLEQTEDNPNLTVHKYVGGGSLLHPRVVLTVAHNVLGKSRATLKVRLGEWDTQTNDEPYPSQDRKVKKVIIHERFVMKTLFNDIALLILDEEVRFAPNVDTICLPPVNKTMDFEGHICYSSGWGKDHFGAEGRYSEIMKRVSVPVVSKDKCQQDLSKSEKLPGFRLDKSFMCAGGTETGDDTCKGDGGSALVCAITDNQHTHYVQVGAVSWGLGCGSTQYPGVYSDIVLLTPWILKQMENEGISTEYCTIHD